MWEIHFIILFYFPTQIDGIGDNTTSLDSHDRHQKKKKKEFTQALASKKI